MLVSLCFLLGLTWLQEVYSQTCPGSWTQNGAKCYLFPTGSYTYSTCNTYCQGQSGTMLCVMDATERAFITPRLRGNTYLGATYYSASPNFLTWISGCTSVYAYWNSGQPGETNAQSVIAASSGYWSTVSPSTSTFCACEDPAASYPTAKPTATPTAPTPKPTAPTAKPTNPTAKPTNPTAKPTAPSFIPTRIPSVQPSSQKPSAKPTTSPTFTSTLPPTQAPTTSKPTAAPSRAAAGCDPSWITGASKCYSYSTVQHDYAGCGAYCAGVSASMLCIENSAEQAFLVANFLIMNTYIGIAQADPLVWNAGCTSTYTNWYTNEPDGTGSGVIFAPQSGTTGGGWEDVPATYNANCACEYPIPTTPTVPPTAVPSTGAPTFKPSASPSAKPTTALPSQAPVANPTAGPTIGPTAEPSRPTVAPSLKPSSSPTASPTVGAAGLAAMRASPSYKQRNGFAFAARTAGGTQVFAWGEGPHGGNASGRVFTGAQYGTTVEVIGSKFAYAAVKLHGHVQVWGSVDAPPVDAPMVVPGSMVASRHAYAAITASTSGVIAFGSEHAGGVINRNSAELSSGVASLAASYASFAALKTDGTVYSWGSVITGGSVSTLTMPSLVDVQLVVASHAAFAALTVSGRVLAWGDPTMGGDTSAVAAQLQSSVVHLIATPSVFVAFKADSSIVVWGHGPWGGDASSVQTQLGSQVRAVYQNPVALAAVKLDGTVVAWGQASGGGDCSAVQANLTSVSRVYSTGKAFAALTTGGRVVAWGKASHGGVIPADKLSALASGVLSVYSTNRAFAALKATGQLVVWGQAGHGGPDPTAEPMLLSGVRTVCANDVAFSAIKSNGDVVSWGHAISVPVPGVVFSAPSLAEGAVCD